ncbi:alpha/beta hydrolase [Cryobacterium sp. PH31-O1]|uniref:alpha/beta hydrolase n=1 Tax=Cryobacterium sp. PH31-O1 TaxID=3046306 RepID=UPI0024B9A7E4|nr:alpha/beta hydrolase [Cryobacterium sp. PH31-O1]MDJ0338190.1 alpha/beta hydrolase [Cryobacterium sp. PH31-O1]
MKKTTLITAFGGLLAIGLLLSACAATPTASVANTHSDSVALQTDLQYGTARGQKLLLNACLPKGRNKPTAAMILIHGGGFDSGSKDFGGMTALCSELADGGIAAFSVDYRLAPKFAYPAQVNDVTDALEWLRDPAQVAEFGIDPERIGVFGSSAGAIIASSIGTNGSGSLTGGDRVAAVVAMSPAVDLTETGLLLGDPSKMAIASILQYLGCDDFRACPNARDASPLYSVDPTDPPFYIAISKKELVPVQQGQAMALALKAVGVPVTLDVKPGERHALELLDEATRASIRQFLIDNLVNSSTRTD